ncbi:GH116 family glycosyl hydrolase [Paenibacillus sp. GCM10027626]|uniref:GH116 family glycosyl hydrolase n=1 Tax=Paenibacillus sp. GCM10027626 TaxID=3273411 RepID=UPI00363250FC
MRTADYRYNQFGDGKMAFRTMLPLGREKWNYFAAADGQMGGIIRTYKEWKISGDTAWMSGLWPFVKKALSYAWNSANEDGWDADGDGVMEGAQHHTLDVEMYGPNAYLSGYYHAALLAAYRMGTALGDPEADDYLRMFENGRAWVDRYAFNGEYYHQVIDLQDKRYPVDTELGQIKYQIGEGCHIDQVIGQWHAHIAGLGSVFDPDKVRTALASLYKYNFISMRDHANANRVYALNDEKGLIVCSWPKGEAPIVPVPYADECMSGFEYQAASHMIYEGLVEEGLSIVRAVRDRYDGERRNPWNEFECGSNYVRAMSSYALLLAFSGFEYDMTEGMIGFSPAEGGERNFRCFWSLAAAWGVVEWRPGCMTMSVTGGRLELRRFGSRLFEGWGAVLARCGKEEKAYPVNGRFVQFDDSLVLRAGERLELIYKEEKQDESESFT